tara:strand:+ start:2962 stop:3786 length:825 start_codon:yes stop_codon:yes gene_type:complete
VHIVDLENVLRKRTDDNVVAALDIKGLLNDIQHDVKILEIRIPPLGLMTLAQTVADVGPYLLGGKEKPKLIQLIETLLLHFDALFLVGRCALMCYVTPNAQTILKRTPSGDGIYRPYSDEEGVLETPHLAMRTPDTSIQHPTTHSGETYEGYIAKRLPDTLPDPMDAVHIQQRYRVMRIVYNDKQRFPDTTPMDEFLRRYNMGLQLLGIDMSTDSGILAEVETVAVKAEAALDALLKEKTTNLTALQRALTRAQETGGATPKMIDEAEKILKTA